MAYDAEEQEQIEALRSWWQQYGSLVLLALTAAALTFATYQGWRYYRHTQAEGAVTLYAQMERAESAGDYKRVREIAARIVERYGSTTYAVLAALTDARAAFGAGDLEAAKSRLRWVMEQAREQEMRDVARLRLAGVLLDEKSHDQALKLLEAAPVEPLSALYADLRGDILLAQGRRAEARAAY
jgi:predicted negative regulator of RcsB-dependent stress response